MTPEEAWSAYQNLPAHLLAPLRERAVTELEHRLWGTGCGISSSDIDHTAVAIMHRDDSRLYERYA